jgi:hypothetical protein
MPFFQANAGLGSGGGCVGLRMVTILRCGLGVFSVADVEIFLVNVPPVTQRPSVTQRPNSRVIDSALIDHGTRATWAYARHLAQFTCGGPSSLASRALDFWIAEYTAEWARFAC